MTTLADILNVKLLPELIEDGYIRERIHPADSSLRILNYTEKAQYEKVWNDETRACRGMIHREGEILARPWVKFFNYGEHPEGSLDLNDWAEVTDKADGSLGILYPSPDGWAIATRGSFESEQAVHATKVFRERYAPVWEPADGLTYLFEIVYPDNRIVLDYGERDDLIMLGCVDIETGRLWGPSEIPFWPGPYTEVFDTESLGEALAMAPRPNAEGVVVRMIHSGTMVKIKQDDYVRLHRLITGLSAKSVWEHLRDHDGDYEDLLASVPEEFHGWIADHATHLLDAFFHIYDEAQRTYNTILDLLGIDCDRKEFAELAQKSQHRGLLFMLLDGKDLAPAIWKSLRPVGFTPMKYVSEDAA